MHSTCAFAIWNIPPSQEHVARKSDGVVIQYVNTSKWKQHEGVAADASSKLRVTARGSAGDADTRRGDTIAGAKRYSVEADEGRKTWTWRLAARRRWIRLYVVPESSTPWDLQPSAALPLATRAYAVAVGANISALSARGFEAKAFGFLDDALLAQKRNGGSANLRMFQNALLDEARAPDTVIAQHERDTLVPHRSAQSSASCGGDNM